MKNYFSIILPITTSILIFFFFLNPKISELQLLKKEISQREKMLQSLENYHQLLKGIFQKLQDYKDFLSKLDSALPTSPFLPEFFNHLENLALKSGILISKINFSPPSKVKESLEASSQTEETIEPLYQLKETKINLSLHGDYLAFKNFLSHLEKSSRLVKIEKISFSPKKVEKIEKPETQTIEFDLEIKIFNY